MPPTGKRKSVLALKLPEIEARTPYTLPTSHLIKVDEATWSEQLGRRASKTLLANRIRIAVDEWRANGYPGLASTSVSRRLLEYWFDEDRLNDHHVTGVGQFRYFLCPREAG